MCPTIPALAPSPSAPICSPSHLLAPAPLFSPSFSSYPLFLSTTPLAHFSLSFCSLTPPHPSALPPLLLLSLPSRPTFLTALKSKSSCLLLLSFSAWAPPAPGELRAQERPFCCFPFLLPVPQQAPAVGRISCREILVSPCNPGIDHAQCRWNLQRI